MTKQENHVIARIKFGREGDVLTEPEASEIASSLAEVKEVELQVSVEHAEPPPCNHDSLPVMGIEAVIASVALATFVHISKRVCDVILDHLKARDNATVEVETPNGKVRITGREATSDRVLKTLDELAKSKEDNI